MHLLKYMLKIQQDHDCFLNFSYMLHWQYQNVHATLHMYCFAYINMNEHIMDKSTSRKGYINAKSYLMSCSICEIPKCRSWLSKTFLPLSKIVLVQVDLAANKSILQLICLSCYGFLEIKQVYELNSSTVNWELLHAKLDEGSTLIFMKSNDNLILSAVKVIMQLLLARYLLYWYQRE